ncbi:hypothetical protein SLA2020_495480 [Shorea laevis]
MAKVLANRLKKILHVLISCHQSAFIPSRLISNNVLVAYEALHMMDTCLKGKKGFMALKLDMGKAYDMVEWDYIEAIMRKMSFADCWISLIMTCVRTVSYSILINGCPRSNFTEERTSIEGSPLSISVSFICGRLEFSYYRS